MPSNHDETLLIFRIDRISCAVAADSVLSIVMPPEHITHPPGSDKGRPGIFRHSGHVFSVTDLHQRFGIETPRKGMGRLLLHEAGIRRHALWVDEVVGLVRSEEGEWAQLPPYLPRTVFHSGFLYSNEIILCSTLDALLAMHDAAPIRLHLEKLHAAELAARTTAEDKTTAGEIPEAPPVTEDKQESPHKEPAATPETITSRPATAPPAKPAISTPVPPVIPATKKPESPAIRKVPVHKEKRAPVQPRTRPVEHEFGKRRDYESPEQGSSLTSPGVSSPLPQESDSGGSWLLWLLIVLLLVASVAGLYLVLQKADRARAKGPQVSAPAAVAVPEATPAQQPSLTVQEELKPEPSVAETAQPHPQEIPDPAQPGAAPLLQEASQEPAEEEIALAEESESQAQQEEIPQPLLEDTVPVGEPPTPVRGGDEATLRIERDEEGIISLIIERERPQAVSGKAAAEIEEVTDTRPPGEEEIAVSPVPPAEEDGETPLQPEVDWPKPTRLVEPCDCIHTVVKGDTLWDIAQRYTNNAFNYPALARESGIRNPHRIYPGDKIRIIVR